MYINNGCEAFLFFGVYLLRIMTNARSQHVGQPVDLSDLAILLEQTKLGHYLTSFHEMGVTETAYLLKLTAMDFRIMQIEWSMTDAEISALQQQILALTSKQADRHIADNPLLEKRARMTYGRLYLNNSVQSFEYLLAGFGTPPPIGWKPLQLANPVDGCTMSNSSKYFGAISLIYRGNCTFITKALNAMRQGASAVVVVNSDKTLIPMGSGVGLHDGGTHTDLPLNISAISLSNSSWSSLLAATQWQKEVSASIVPLECKIGDSTCLPITEEEQGWLREVSWGHLYVSNPAHGTILLKTEFLTSTFGGVLPVDPLAITMSYPAQDGCQQPEDAENKILIVRRGTCPFGVKALNAQRAGARLLVVLQTGDEPLQRVAASAHQVAALGIAAIIVTTSAGDQIERALTSCASTNVEQQATSSCITARVVAANNTKVADSWIDLARTGWSDDPVEKYSQLIEALNKNLGDNDRQLWVQRQLLKCL